jgi:hypothetical protein
MEANTAPTPFRMLRPLVTNHRMNSDESTTTTTGPYLIRLNYGVAAIKLRMGCIVDGYWSHTFHLTLPKDARRDQVTDSLTRTPSGVVTRSPETPTPETLNSSLVCKGPCHQLEGLLSATKALGMATLYSIGRMNDRINALLTDMTTDWLRDRRRESRGLFNAIGSVSSYLFGTATNADVDSIRQEIRRIKLAADISNADSTRTRDGMSTFARLQNTRLDSMRAVLDQDQKTLEVLYNEVRASNTEHALEQNILSHAMLELAQFVDVHDGIMELELGVEDLVHGQITPRFN